MLIDAQGGLIPRVGGYGAELCRRCHLMTGIGIPRKLGHDAPEMLQIPVFHNELIQHGRLSSSLVTVNGGLQSTQTDIIAASLVSKERPPTAHAVDAFAITDKEGVGACARQGPTIPPTLSPLSHSLPTMLLRSINRYLFSDLLLQ